MNSYLSEFEETLVYAEEIVELHPEEVKKVPGFLRVHALRTFLGALQDGPWEGKTDEGLTKDAESILSLTRAAAMVASCIVAETRLREVVEHEVEVEGWRRTAQKYGAKLPADREEESVKAELNAQFGKSAQGGEEVQGQEEAVPEPLPGYRKLGELPEKEKREIGVRAGNGEPVNSLAGEYNISKQAVGRCRVKYGA